MDGGSLRRGWICGDGTRSGDWPRSEAVVDGFVGAGAFEAGTEALLFADLGGGEAGVTTGASVRVAVEACGVVDCVYRAWDVGAVVGHGV